jgi:hypothetical protein
MAVSIAGLVVFVVAPLLSMVFLLVVISRNKKMAERRFRRGVEHIKMLRELLRLIQQHRGLTTGFLSGNIAVIADIKKIGIKIKLLLVCVSAASCWISENAKWSSLLDHWQRLAESYLQANADNNFKQHNILIANLLYLIEDLADEHHLVKLDGRALDTDWRYLLSVAEYVGQARALGAGVAAKGECSAVVRIQLSFLCAKISACIDENWPAKLKSALGILLNSIETRLMLGQVSIAPAEYFQQATICIDQLLVQFDQQIDELQFFRGGG